MALQISNSRNPRFTKGTSANLGRSHHRLPHVYTQMILYMDVYGKFAGIAYLRENDACLCMCTGVTPNVCTISGGKSMSFTWFLLLLEFLQWLKEACLESNSKHYLAKNPQVPHARALSPSPPIGA